MDLQKRYLAIQGKKKTDKETNEICTGTQAQLDQIVEHFILPKKIPVFLGVPKIGFEYRPKHKQRLKLIQRT
jgi:hypothetical protein